MASVKKRLSENVAGQFYVDSTCINCDTCRQLAPASFLEQGDYSSVYHQPTTVKETGEAYQALLACPVGSIGTIQSDKKLLQTAQSSFPLPIDGPVFYAGFNSEKSFGGNSYFIQHPEGNWLIDSPRYIKYLVDQFEQLGGIRYIFLTHEDDVADADRYAKHFGATRIIHRADVHAQPGAELIIEDLKVVTVNSDFLIVPCPGHTPGSMALLFRKQYLFSGDHIWWDPSEMGLHMPSRYVRDEAALIQSTERLSQYRFEWVLPGHGHRIHLAPTQMQEALQALLSSRRRARTG